MKYLCTFLLSLLGICNVNAQVANPKFDKALADSLGADEYGMKMYVLAMLKTGTYKTTDKKELDSLFSGHMSNMKRLADEGKLIIAGPFEKNDKSYRGIFIFNVSTIDEANALVVTDPAVTSKLLDVELYQWYGSAALPVYMKTDEKIHRKSH